MSAPRAIDVGLLACHACGLVSRDLAVDEAAAATARFCPRCDERVRTRKSNSLARTTAFLVAAAALYVPANVLPIMKTVQFPSLRHDTILSGVVHLWELGSWDLAVIVFTASIVVPLAKMIALGLLVLTTRRASRWRPRARTRLFRFLEVVGYWSMLDVFVVALLVSLVRFGPFGNVDAGPAIVPFGSVVVLTMLSAMSFDPRLLWDRAEGTS